MNLVVLTLAWIGAAFVLAAAVGILRMPDVFGRLQASSKAPTLGVALLATAMTIHFADGSVAARAGALILILFVTAPVAAHLIARAAFVSGADLEPDTVLDDEARRMVPPTIARLPDREGLSGSDHDPR